MTSNNAFGLRRQTNIQTDEVAVLELVPELVKRCISLIKYDQQNQSVEVDLSVRKPTVEANSLPRTDKTVKSSRKRLNREVKKRVCSQSLGWIRFNKAQRCEGFSDFTITYLTGSRF